MVSPCEELPELLPCEALPEPLTCARVPFIFEGNLKKTDVRYKRTTIMRNGGIIKF
jgi:hypothetical protein